MTTSQRRTWLSVLTSKVRGAAGAALLLISTHASSQELRSKTFYATGQCTGVEQVAILQPPWESAPIRIVGIGIGLQLDSLPSNAYIFAGNSYVPDLMALHVGAGSETVMYPAKSGFALPAADVDPASHVDAHVSCSTPPPPLAPWTIGASLKAHLQWLLPVAVAQATKPAGYQAWLTVFYEMR